MKKRWSIREDDGMLSIAGECDCTFVKEIYRSGCFTRSWGQRSSQEAELGPLALTGTYGTTVLRYTVFLSWVCRDVSSLFGQLVLVFRKLGGTKYAFIINLLRIIRDYPFPFT